MSSQGTKSNTNGQLLQNRVLETLREMGYSPVKEHPTGIEHALCPGTMLRCDIYLPEHPTFIECKAHSGQSGTLYQKLPYSFMSYRATGSRVVFVLGDGFSKHPRQVAALRTAAMLVSPLIQILLEHQVVEYQWASVQP